MKEEKMKIDMNEAGIPETAIEFYRNVTEMFENEYPNFKGLVSEQDIAKIYQQKDDDIKDRPEIKTFKKIRNRILYHSNDEQMEEKTDEIEENNESDEKNTIVSPNLKMTEKDLDKSLNEQINKNFGKRVQSYYEALRRLVMKYPDFKQESVTYEDIKKLANYEDKEIKQRLEIRMLQKERNKMLSEERKALEKQLNKEVMKEFNSSEVFSTAVTKGIIIGLLRSTCYWICSS